MNGKAVIPVTKEAREAIRAKCAYAGKGYGDCDECYSECKMPNVIFDMRALLDAIEAYENAIMYNNPCFFCKEYYAEDNCSGEKWDKGQKAHCNNYEFAFENFAKRK